MTSDKLISPDVYEMSSLTTDVCSVQGWPLSDDQPVTVEVPSIDEPRMDGATVEPSVSYAVKEACNEKETPANKMLCDLAMKGLSLGYDLSVVSTVLRTVNPMHDSISKFVELLIQCDKRQRQMTDQRKRLTRQYRSTLTNSHRYPFQFVLDGMDIITTFRDCNNESCLTMKGLVSAYNMLEPLNFGTCVVVVSGDIWNILKNQRNAEDQELLESLQAQDRLIVASGDSLTSRHWILELIPWIASRRSIIFTNGSSKLSLFNFRSFIMNLCKYPSGVDFATFHFKRNRFIIDDISCVSYDHQISNSPGSVSSGSLPPRGKRSELFSHKSNSSTQKSTIPYYDKQDSAREGSVITTLCPYNMKCTYGNKCKYYHPERGPLKQMSLSEQISLKAAVEKNRFKESLRRNGSLTALVDQMADHDFVDRSVGRFRIVASDFAEFRADHSVAVIPSANASNQPAISNVNTASSLGQRVASRISHCIGPQQSNPYGYRLQSSTVVVPPNEPRSHFFRDELRRQSTPGDNFLPANSAFCLLSNTQQPCSPCRWPVPHLSEQAYVQSPNPLGHSIGYKREHPVSTNCHLVSQSEDKTAIYALSRCEMLWNTATSVVLSQEEEASNLSETPKIYSLQSQPILPS